MKLIGRWHEPSSTGFMVVETDDYQAVMKYCQQWNRTCHIEVTPVGTDADAAATLLRDFAALTDPNLTPKRRIK